MGFKAIYYYCYEFLIAKRNIGLPHNHKMEIPGAQMCSYWGGERKRAQESLRRKTIQHKTRYQLLLLRKAFFHYCWKDRCASLFSIEEEEVSEFFRTNRLPRYGDLIHPVWMNVSIYQ